MSFFLPVYFRIFFKNLIPYKSVFSIKRIKFQIGMQGGRRVGVTTKYKISLREALFFFFTNKFLLVEVPIFLVFPSSIKYCAL